MVAVNMHHGKEHNHISSRLPFTLVSGFPESGEGYHNMVLSRRAPLANMHHDKQQTHSSSSFSLTLVSGVRGFGECLSLLIVAHRCISLLQPEP